MEVIERIPVTGWKAYRGHLERYAYAGRMTRPGEVVNDIACGVGYGCTYLLHATYRGYDRPGVPQPRWFRGDFRVADLDDPLWLPEPCDVTVCLETLEHVVDPVRLARVIAATTRRAVIVSVPIIETTNWNPHHRHDFSTTDIPPLFPEFDVSDEWDQPSDRAHVWTFERRVATSSPLS